MHKGVYAHWSSLSSSDARIVKNRSEAAAKRETAVKGWTYWDQARGTIGTMGVIQAEVCVCDACGHRWLSGGELPERCAKCKSRKWNERGYVETARPMVKRRPAYSPTPPKPANWTIATPTPKSDRGHGPDHKLCASATCPKCN